MTALRHPLRTPVLILVGLAALAWAGRFLYHYFRYETTDDAYVTGHIHQVSPQIGGQVLSVLARENETVKQGQELVRIDPLTLDIAAQKAEAALKQAQGTAAEVRAAAENSDAKLMQSKADANEAQAKVAQARAQAALAHTDYLRSQRLSSGEDRAVTQAALDQARSQDEAAAAAVQAAEARAAAAQADIKAAQAERDAAGGQVQSADAAVALARAALADARHQLSYVTVPAPAAGRIGNKNVEVGNRVQAGETLMVLVEPHVWIEANFKETQLAKMRVGQPVDIEIDAVPGRTFTGRVASFAPATGAEFALLPADNATGNFTKVVQRVPVRIEFDPGSIRGYEARLRPGLSATVDVDLHG
ncbi:MAG TPA: HlyD family secretion protein [Opitutaceae bacterium]|jgi:membrane fusion protein (multidrug efflux system)|nr:HlyD family secretion protein [Opitutaceae bacterium]